MIEQFLQELKELRDSLGMDRCEETRDVPVEYQLNLLGIDEKRLRYLYKNKSKGFDIGCGDGSLVEFMNSQGIPFEGIDIRAPNKPYFIRQLITRLNGFGGIPRKDNSYDIVTAFQNTSINSALLEESELKDLLEMDLDESHRQRLNDISIHGQSIIYEGARIIKPGGRFVIYPFVDKLDEVMGPMLRLSGIEHNVEEVNRNMVRDYMKWELGRLSREIHESHFYRSVITKLK
jgi:hypothetical protein